MWQGSPLCLKFPTEMKWNGIFSDSGGRVVEGAFAGADGAVDLVAVVGEEFM